MQSFYELLHVKAFFCLFEYLNPVILAKAYVTVGMLKFWIVYGAWGISVLRGHPADIKCTFPWL